jgi:hypothetical protein
MPWANTRCRWAERRVHTRAFCRVIIKGFHGLRPSVNVHLIIKESGPTGVQQGPAQRTQDHTHSVGMATKVPLGMNILFITVIWGPCGRVIINREQVCVCVSVGVLYVCFCFCAWMHISVFVLWSVCECLCVCEFVSILVCLCKCVYFCVCVYVCFLLRECLFL